MTIPATVWQTARSLDLPPPARPLTESWQRHNPRWRTVLCDDAGIDEFIASHFDRSLLDAFRAMPVPVMRADIWRYAVLHVNGGVYADLDAECMAPLDDWLSPQADIVVGLENDVHFCQWTFATAPGSALTAHALDLVMERWHEGIDTSRKHFVHHHTGPGLWTDAVRRLFGAEGDARTVYRECVGTCANVQLLDADALNGRLVRHHYGSQHWRDEAKYGSWLDDRERLYLLHHATPRQRPSWFLRRDADGCRIVHARYAHAVSCNESAAWVFSRCDGSRTVVDMVEELRRTLSPPPADLETQVCDSLKLLRQHRLIRF